MSRVLSESKAIPVDEVEVGERLRPVSEAGVETVKQSVETLGRITDAIQVRLVGRGAAERLVLMAGAHRLEVAKRLGHEKIKAVVWECNDDEAALFECDDNLARAELSVLEVCVFAARRKEAYLRLHPETAQGAAGAAARWDEMQRNSISFASSLAEKRGISERHARNFTSIGERLLAATVKALQSPVKGAKIDLKTLKDLSRIEGTEQALVASFIARGETKKVKAALDHLRGEPPRQPDPIDDAYEQLAGRFKRAPRAVQRRFLSHLWQFHAALMAEEADIALGGPAE